MTLRERRPWTSEEDDLLRAAVALEEPGNPNPSKWFTIATHVPGRSNKDCRKRWFARMAVDIVRGVWSAEEDAKLMNAVTKHGTKWSLVATMVHSRNSDQCAKRWTDTLDPSIDRSGWTPELDRILCNAVNEHGTCWKKIVRTYFPGRTGLSAKNRYTSLTRTQNISRSPRRSQSIEDINPSVGTAPFDTPFLTRPATYFPYSRPIHRSTSTENSDGDSSVESYHSNPQRFVYNGYQRPSYIHHSGDYWNPSYIRFDSSSPARISPSQDYMHVSHDLPVSISSTHEQPHLYVDPVAMSNMNPYPHRSMYNYETGSREGNKVKLEPHYDDHPPNWQYV